MSKFTEKEIVKFLTEYKIENYDEISQNHDYFVTFSQYKGHLTSLKQVRASEGTYTTYARCSPGEILYAVDYTNGCELTEIRSIIDSSD